MPENPYQSPANAEMLPSPRPSSIDYLVAGLNFLWVFVICLLIAVLALRVLVLRANFAASGAATVYYWIGAVLLALMFGTLRSVLSLRKAHRRASRILAIREEQENAIEEAKRTVVVDDKPAKTAPETAP